MPRARVADIAAPSPEEVLVVVGPTASGKSALALELAERFGGEIVGADSVQIYREFDLGSGKPDEGDLARAAHHLVSAVGPLEPMDAAIFAGLADASIEAIRARGRTPIVCGGTFLWIKALLRGLADAAPRDDALRARHVELATEHGRPALHAMLQKIDPEAAAKLAPNDLVRVSRALEIHELTGRPMSEWHRAHGFSKERYPHRLIGVERPKDELDARITERARAWLEGGWIPEVRGLLGRGYRDARAMGSVGYREVRAFVDGELTEAELLQAVVRSTRTFVRRQRTWLRDEPVLWIS